MFIGRINILRWLSIRVDDVLVLPELICLRGSSSLVLCLPSMHGVSGYMLTSTAVQEEEAEHWQVRVLQSEESERGRGREEG